MTRYILLRLLTAVPVVWAILTLTFFLVRLAPGGPFDAERKVPEETLRQLMRTYNLDAPWYRQYVDYIAAVARGDLGPSFRKPSRTVSEWLALRLPVSLELGVYALLVAVGIGLTAGIMAAWHPNTWADHLPMAFSMLGICLPNFVLGPLLVLVFALVLGLVPVSGWDTPSSKILPSVTLGLMYAAYIARLVRAGMLEILTQDFIRTARAKGMSSRRLLWRHAFWGGIQPALSFLGPATAGLLTGSFVVETVFQIPGLGREFVESAFNRDYTMISGAVLVYGVLVVACNFVADLLLAWCDPRIRLGER